MTDKPMIAPSYFNSLWRFLASLKLTVFLLLCLAGLSIIGTVIPQNSSPQEYVRIFGMFRYQLFLMLDIVDMYHSWWFTGLLLFLVINIIVCSIDRLSSTGKIIFTRNPVFNLESYRKRKSRRTFKTSNKPSALEAAYQRIIGKQFGYLRVVPVDGGMAFTAERGRWTRLGVYVVHLSIVVLLVGGVVGSKWGFDGFVNLPEGQTSDTIELNRSGRTHRLPFSIRCDDFNATFYEGTQRPKEFRASLTILEQGREILSRDIVVNAPLYYKGIGIYISNYGRLDPVASQADSAPIGPTDEVAVVFRSVESGMEYRRKALIGQTVKMPEGLGQLVIDRYEPSAKFKGMDLGPALIATLTNANGATQSVTLPLRFPQFDAMRKGMAIISVQTMKQAPVPQERYFAGLQVVHDPGVVLVYTGFAMMIIGCVVAFFMSHQQVVIEVVERGKGGVVTVSGKTNKNKVGFQMKLAQLTDRLADAAGSDSPGA